MSPAATATRLRDEPDVVLVAAAQRGDSAALDTLLRRHYDRVVAVCRRITQNEADAADAAQNALISVARAIGGFDGTAQFTTWLHRVASNAALDELRRRKRRPEPTSFDPPTDREERPRGIRELGALDVRLERIDDSTAIGRALAHIHPEFRAPLALRDLCGLDYAEIAEVLGIPPGTVRSRISRGRAALAPHLSSLVDPDGESAAAVAPAPTTASSPAAPSTESPSSPGNRFHDTVRPRNNHG
jgi:RNA polymerase sigma-70 factor, ECF subfamily